MKVVSMQYLRSVIPSFLVCFVIALLFLGLSQLPVLQLLAGIVQEIALPGQRVVYAASHTSKLPDTAALTHATYQAQLAKLKQDNAALHDQFQTATIPTQHLLPVQIIGMPGYSPYVSQPRSLIIAAGSANHITQGMVVVYKDSVIGKISTVSAYRSEVQLISDTNVSVTAIDSQTQAVGILRGEGDGGLALANVVLADTLHPGDIVVTKGDEDVAGRGFPPNLVLGKIRSVEKQESSLFQAAQIESLVDVTKLTEVFVKVE